MGRLAPIYIGFKTIVLTLGVAVFLMGAAAAFGQCSPVEEAILMASDWTVDENFGGAVAIDGDYAVVGSYKAINGGQQSGAAYIYHYDGTQWVEETKLVEPSGQPNSQFGWSVAIEGETVVVGAPAADIPGVMGSAGVVFVYGRSAGAWTPQQDLYMADARIGDRFGTAVSLSGDGLLIGSETGDAFERPITPTAFVYRFNGTSWLEEARLVHPHSLSLRLSEFGEAVDLSGDVAVVGAANAHNGVTYTGAAYVFHFDGTTWTEQAELIADDLENAAGVGFSLAVDGDVVALGAKDTDIPGMLGTGSVYVFRFDGTQWSQEAALVSLDVANDDQFGYRVDVKGDLLISTAPRTDNACAADPLCDSGSAFVFLHDGSQWVQDQEFVASDGVALDHFGQGGVATDGVKVLVSANLADGSGVGSGKAYVYSLNCSTVVSGVESPLPGRVVSLHQNYPNPFNPATTIRFSLRATEEVTLAVYDVTGRLIRTIAERSFAAGEHEVTWRGRDERGGAAPSGVYFVRLNAGGVVESQKIVLNK